MPMKTVHCRLCGKPIKGRDFAERMKKLRHHRKEKHPTAHRKSVKKTLKTKGIYDPLKARRGLIKKPKVLSFKDYDAKGLIRLLNRENNLFPEFAIYPTTHKLVTLQDCFKDAGFKQESRGKWVLRTNKFNIFVYI